MNSSSAAEAAARLRTALADRYTIERELGAGGMATVYLAEDIKHHRKVAIKVLRPDLAAALGPERFAQEIEIAARLSHPHILPVHDSGQSDGFLYYVMPYVEGESLRERLERDGELPVADAVRLLSDIADALAYAHSRSVVHRDIKPENVMLSGRHALVMDFGVAKAISEASGRNRLTTAGVALGTPTYMAPEQASADPHLDHRVDIYALGVVGYELLAGRPPFVGGSLQQVLAAHVTQTPDPVTRYRPNIAPALADVIMKALAKRPSDRWQSANEMLAQLEPLQSASGGSTPTATRPIVAISRPRRVPWIVAGITLLALATVAFFFFRRGDAGATVSVATTHALTTDAGLYLDPALSPDGKFLAYAAGSPSRMHLYVRSVDGGRAIPLTDSIPGRQRWPKWSPDGKQIVYVSDAGVSVVPALGGAPRLLAETHDIVNPVLGATWSPDGKRVAYVVGNALHLFDLTGNRDSVVANLTYVNRAGAIVPQTRLFELAWSPDGRWIAAARGNTAFAFGTFNLANIAPANISIIDVSSGRSTPVRMGDSSERVMSLSPIWQPDGRHLLVVSTLNGGRDVYQVTLSAQMEEVGLPVRLTTGLAAHSISLTADGQTLAYSSYQPVTNIWAIPIPASGEAPAATGREITHGTDLIEQAAPSPDGQWLAFVSNRAGTAHAFRMPMQGGTATQLTRGSFDEFSVAWSRDSKEISYNSSRTGRSRVFVMDAGGGQEHAVTDTTNGRDASWAPDGNQLVLVASASGPIGHPTVPLQIVERRNGTWGQPRPISGTEGGYSPAWSPDGLTIAYVDQSGAIQAIVPAGGTPRQVAPGAGATSSGPPVQIIWSDDSHTLYYQLNAVDGTSAVWAVPASGGVPHRVIRYDDPDLQAGRLFGIAKGIVYVRLIRHLSTIGIAQLVPR